VPLDLGDDATLLVRGYRLIIEIGKELLDLGQRLPPHGPGQPMRNLLAEDVVGRQSDGIDIVSLLQPRIDRRAGTGGVSAEEPEDVAFGIAGDHRVRNIPPAIGTVDVAVAQGAAFQHAELVKQEVWVVAGAVKMPHRGEPFLIAVGGADRDVHVQHDEFQCVTVIESVDPLPVQIRQRGTVLGQSQRFGLELPHLGSRSSLRNDSPASA
jgi:hypothetical protein